MWNEVSKSMKRKSLKRSNGSSKNWLGNTIWCSCQTGFERQSAPMRKSLEISERICTVHGKVFLRWGVHWGHEVVEGLWRPQNAILRYSRVQLCATRGRFM